MTDKSWREGPPRALPLLLFRQTYDLSFNMVLRQLDIPRDVTLKNVGTWLRQNSYADAGMKYTVLSVATEDVFEIGRTHDEVTVSNIESTIY